MAHFQAGIQGNRGPVTRLGTGKSGIYAFARGWQGGGSIRMWEQDGEDYIVIEIGPHRLVGEIVIIEGPISKVIEWSKKLGVDQVQ